MPIRNLDIASLDTTGAQYGANLTYVVSNARFEWVSGIYIPRSLSPDWSQTPTESKIVASDAQGVSLFSGDYFGEASDISSDGNYVIVGASGEDGGGGDPYTDCGAAYIFVRSGSSWSQQAKLLASDRAINDRFGQSVSINEDGTRAIVGADADNNADGAAYIFVRSGTSWSQQQKISGETNQFDRFGENVTMSSDGTYVLIYAEAEDTGGSDVGATYVYVRSHNSWSQQAKITSPNPENYQRFGSALSLNEDGTYAVIGAYGEAVSSLNDAGAVYIYTRSGSSWSQQTRLTSASPTSSNQFGNSVSINADGTTLAIGEVAGDTEATSAGEVYIFTRSGSTWTQQALLTASDAEESDLFGAKVSLSADGNHVVIGALSEDTGGSLAGAAYVFARSGSTWTQKAKIQASDKQANDYFSQSVSINSNGSFVISGAKFEAGGAGDPKPYSGAAYIYEVGGYGYS